MNKRIYVFSGSGNSLYLAKKIAGSVGECEIVGVGKDTVIALDGVEMVGFVFPTHYCAAPKIVKDKLRALVGADVGSASGMKASLTEVRAEEKSEVSGDVEGKVESGCQMAVADSVVSECVESECVDSEGAVNECVVSDGVEGESVVSGAVNKCVVGEGSVVIEPKPYVFVLATCGGFAGNAVSGVVEILAEKGVKVDFGLGVKMVANAVTHYDLKSKGAIAKKLAKADKNIDKIAEQIRGKESNKTKKQIAFLKKMNAKWEQKVGNFAKDYVVSDDCVACGGCVNICPTRNIQLKAVESNKGEQVEGGTAARQKPVFGEDCQACLACLHNCSKSAINYQTKTQKRGRYRHPQIAISELVAINKTVS
ncbi:MAG: EFR1 family ferrodoxin [Firmicutes bacterium]|nr:EFR1 family ferrodoxin [Bacillota bacterium]